MDIGSKIIKQPRLSVWFGPEDLPYKYSFVSLKVNNFKFKPHHGKNKS